MEIRQFNVVEANWELQGRALLEIRRVVFIVEQNVPPEEEWDGRDEESWHFVATDESDVAIGTGRLLPDGQIGRMAVMPSHRGCGVGFAILEQAVAKARRLGMAEVFLHAQTHALGFYEKAGFVAEGEEFEDAGIPHLAMRMQLGETDRSPASLDELDLAVALRQYDVSEGNPPDFPLIDRLLRAVFGRERGLGVKGTASPTPAHSDGDAIDAAESGLETPGQAEPGLPNETSVSAANSPIPSRGSVESGTPGTSGRGPVRFLARNADGHVVGHVALDADGSLLDLAVLPEHRRRAVAHSLMEAAATRAHRLGMANLSLRLNHDLGDVALSAGYERGRGDADQATDLWTLSLARDDPHGREKSTLVGDDYGDARFRYLLGETSRLVLLRREDEFRGMALELARQATLSLRIYTPVFDHKIYDNDELSEMLSALARRNRHTNIKILLYDSHRTIKNGHRLLELSRRLSSSINIRIVHPDYRQQNHEYMLADTRGLVYRLEHDVYDGYANFKDITEANRLAREFNRAWDTSLIDPNIRQLRI